MSRTDDELLIKIFGKNGADLLKEGIEWHKVTVFADIGGLVFWTSEYCDECVVLSPEELADRVRERLKRGGQAYGLPR